MNMQYAHALGTLHGLQKLNRVPFEVSLGVF